MRSSRASAAAACALLLAFPARPAPAALPAGRAVPGRMASPARVQAPDSARHLDVNRINMYTSNLGSFAWDLATRGSGLVWPRGAGQTAVFAAGLWLGARVSGGTRAALAEYSFEYGPGSMVGGTFDDPSRPQYRVYKVARWGGSPSDSAHVSRTAAELAADPRLDPLVHHSWSEYLAGAAPYGAPTRTYRLPVTATFDPTDSLDVVGPDVMGDQMLWCVYNDADPSLHGNNAGGTAPLGVEVRQTTFAFDRADDLGNVLFMRFRILNRGSNTLDSMFVSLWSDPDLGGASDDLVGCDPGRALGYCYNALPSDAQYGAPPPAVGFTLLRGPPDPSSGAPLGLTSFIKYIGGTDPGSVEETFNDMKGLLPDGGPILDPTTGQPTTYVHAGDPVTAQGWLDGNPADRRLLLSSGPSRMLPGESQDIWAAIVVGRGADRLASIAAVRCLTDLARAAFGQGFSPLPAPSAACSSAVVAQAPNCPQPASFWAGECRANGVGELTAAQLDSVAVFVDAQSALFAWGPIARDRLCATTAPYDTTELRVRARSEFATFLANYAGHRLDLSTAGGQRIGLHPNDLTFCSGLPVLTIEQLAATAVLTLGITDASYLNDVQTHRRALQGVDSGLPFFGGGAGEGNDFFGSTLDGAADPDSFGTVEIRFSHAATQKCYRYLREEKAGGDAPANVGRRYPYSGFYDCGFQVWDVTHDVQLDAAFVERALVADDDGTLSPDTSTAIPSMDRTWGPSVDPAGDHEYLLILKRPYSDTPKDEFRVDGAIANGGFPLLYALTARLREASDVIDDGDGFRFLWGYPGIQGADARMLVLEGRPLADPAVQQGYRDLIECLSVINAGIGIGATCGPGSTPLLAWLLSAEASPGSVRLRWAADFSVDSATVERRLDGLPWAPVGRATSSDGFGYHTLEFEDRQVIAGAPYGYRLAVAGASGTAYYGEAQVLVPSRTFLQFLGARAAPGDRGLIVSLVIPSPTPVRIEVLDVAGRRLATDDFTWQGPQGSQLLVGEGVRFRSGVYLVRVTQGGRSVTGKAAIVR